MPAPLDAWGSPTLRWRREDSLPWSTLDDVTKAEQALSRLMLAAELATWNEGKEMDEQ
ncbi:MAG: hypothetical protein IPI49_28570 [Myxococcales bacterium]|nr:hypothetical protein [Myxococcales bacterium]